MLRKMELVNVFFKEFVLLFLQSYRKVLLISPGLRQLCKGLWVGL